MITTITIPAKTKIPPTLPLIIAVIGFASGGNSVIDNYNTFEYVNVNYNLHPTSYGDL